MTHPTDNPYPIVLDFQHDGILITCLGEDSDLIIALGHHPVGKFLAAAAALAADLYLDIPTPENTDELEWDAVLDDVEYAWAVRIPLCADHHPDDCPDGPCEPQSDQKGAPWALAFDDHAGTQYTGHTPGAFPVTLLYLGDL